MDLKVAVSILERFLRSYNGIDEPCLDCGFGLELEIEALEKVLEVAREQARQCP